MIVSNLKKAKRQKLSGWMDKGFVANDYGMDKFRRNKIVLAPLNFKQEKTQVDHTRDYMMASQPYLLQFQ